MEILRKYGVATNVYIPMIKAGARDFAIGADWTPAAGDVKISKDGGAAANITTLPVAITMGNGAMWNFALSATEMQAAKINITIVDAVTKAVEDQMIMLSTYGNASGEHAFDLDTASVTLAADQPVNVTKVAGTLQTARDLGANIDVATSTRLAAASYTAPDNATIATIQADTNDIQARLPAALVGGKIDAALDVAERAAIADKLLGRNIKGAADAGRKVSEALAFLRNKWAISGATLTVYDEDDLTPLFTAAITRAAVDAITASDPV